MSVTFPGVVELIGIGEFGEDGTWVFSQRMEEESVDDDTKDLISQMD